MPPAMAALDAGIDHLRVRHLIKSVRYREIECAKPHSW
jgi:hypothetical protein